MNTTTPHLYRLLKLALSNATVANAMSWAEATRRGRLSPETLVPLIEELARQVKYYTHLLQTATHTKCRGGWYPPPTTDPPPAPPAPPPKPAPPGIVVFREDRAPEEPARTMTLERAVEHAAELLPPTYTIALMVENGAASLYLKHDITGQTLAVGPTDSEETLAECVASAGGPIVPDPNYLVGGVMMGHLEDNHDALVDKTTGGVIVLPNDHVIVRRRRQDCQQTARIGRSACDQCSFCTELCPRYLLGHPIEPHRAIMISAGLAQW